MCLDISNLPRSLFRRCSLTRYVWCVVWPQSVAAQRQRPRCCKIASLLFSLWCWLANLGTLLLVVWEKVGWWNSSEINEPYKVGQVVVTSAPIGPEAQVNKSRPIARVHTLNSRQRLGPRTAAAMRRLSNAVSRSFFMSALQASPAIYMCESVEWEERRICVLRGKAGSKCKQS